MLEVKSGTIGWAATVTVAEPEAITPLPSVTLNVSVKLPFTDSVLDIVPVPVYGAVPPVAETVQVNGLPAVIPVDGHVAVTTRGWGAIVTLDELLAEKPFESVTVKDSVNVPFTVSVLEMAPVPV